MWYVTKVVVESDIHDFGFPMYPAAKIQKIIDLQNFEIWISKNLPKSIRICLLGPSILLVFYVFGEFREKLVTQI